MDAERLVISEGTIYLTQNDLQYVWKQDGATLSIIKADGIAYDKEE